MDAKSVKEAARRFGADLVGITSIGKFDGVAPQNDPRNIFRQGKNMIVIGRKIPRGALRGVESQSVSNGVFDDFGLYMLEDQYLAKKYSVFDKYYKQININREDDIFTLLN